MFLEQERTRVSSFYAGKNEKKKTRARCPTVEAYSYTIYYLDKLSRSKRKTIMLQFPPHENFVFDSNEKDIELTVSNFVTNSLKQQWIKSNSPLIIKKLTDGLSNILFAVRSSENNGVITKIYGTNSDLIVDRQAEIRFMIYLAQFHMSPSIFLTFNNGFIYQYVPGEPIANGDESKS
jgi:hypothetical protein